MVIIGVSTGADGAFRSGGLGLWCSGSLACFFTAHLLSIPHNSGRYWAVYVSLGLMLLAAAKSGVYFGWLGMASHGNLPIAVGLGVPALFLLSGVLVLLLLFHPSVGDFFDGLDGEN